MGYRWDKGVNQRKTKVITLAETSDDVFTNVAFAAALGRAKLALATTRSRDLPWITITTTPSATKAICRVCYETSEQERQVGIIACARLWFYWLCGYLAEKRRFPWVFSDFRRTRPLAFSPQ